MFDSSEDVHIGMDQAFLIVTSVDRTKQEILDVYGVSDNCYKVSEHAFSDFYHYHFELCFSFVIHSWQHGSYMTYADFTVLLCLIPDDFTCQRVNPMVDKTLRCLIYILKKIQLDSETICFKSNEEW